MTVLSSGGQRMLGKLEFLIGWDMQGEKSREIPPIAISTS